MQGKQLRGTGFFQRVLTTPLIASGVDGTEECSEFVKSQISFTLVLWKMQKSIALQCQAMCVTYLGLWLETLLPELVTREGGLVWMG